LNNISFIIKELLTFGLIKEIGMPLQYDYKMKTLVLFIKPTDVEAMTKLDHVFQRCNFGYSHLVINVGPEIEELPKSKAKSNSPEKPHVQDFHKRKEVLSAVTKVHFKETAEPISVPTIVSSETKTETETLSDCSTAEKNDVDRSPVDLLPLGILFLASAITLYFAYVY
jgi:hypothetical protein